MSFSISGKTAIVTGAANGIGLAVARHFAAQGANLMFADMDEASLTKEVGKVTAEDEINIRCLELIDANRSISPNLHGWRGRDNRRYLVITSSGGTTRGKDRRDSCHQPPQAPLSWLADVGSPSKRATDAGLFGWSRVTRLSVRTNRINAITRQRNDVELA